MEHCSKMSVSAIVLKWFILKNKNFQSNLHLNIKCGFCIDGHLDHYDSSRGITIES